MSSHLINIILAADSQTRDQPLETWCNGASMEQLLKECEQLDLFRRQSDNLYKRVRALFFLYAIHRFHLPPILGPVSSGIVPFAGYEDLLNRRFNEAIDLFLKAQTEQGPSDAICNALASAYHDLAFQTLANQVRRSVRQVKGNQWMFRVGHPADQ